MRLLFVAFALSFCALLWVAFSVARHILRHDHAQAAGAAEPDGVASSPESRRPGS
jgi:hypothetical protein